MGQLRNKKLDKAVGSRISELRQKANFDTSIKFAERYNFDHQTLRSIESGHVTINTTTLKWFAETLNVSSDYLLGISRAKSLDDSVQTFVDRYGLDEESLKTLEILTVPQLGDFDGVIVRVDEEEVHHISYDERMSYNGTKERKASLKALNAILSDFEYTRAVFTLINSILFVTSGDADRTLHIFKKLRISEDEFERKRLFLLLNDVLERLREEVLSGSNNDTKTKNKSKPTTTKKEGAENGGN